MAHITNTPYTRDNARSPRMAQDQRTQWKASRQSKEDAFRTRGAVVRDGALELRARGAARAVDVAEHMRSLLSGRL